MVMNIYLISAPTRGWGVYDSAVVAAPDETSARCIHPSWDGEDPLENIHLMEMDRRDWVHGFESVTAKLIGTTDLPMGVICASFNAG
jgi:hypothetical protein